MGQVIFPLLINLTLGDLEAGQDNSVHEFSDLSSIQETQNNTVSSSRMLEERDESDDEVE